MSHTLAALAVSMLALDSCSKKAPFQEVQLRQAKIINELWTVNGEPLTGVIHDQYKDGKPRVRWELLEGQMHGVIREWRENGNLNVETHFENGKRHGLNRYWDKEGQLMKEQVYEHGVSISIKEWQNGEPVSAAPHQ